MRILTGIEVDILDDGSLDQEPELLERLDVVVASVHSKLSMDAAAMTRRMVRAVSSAQADVLGHCTGRLVEGNRGIRPESKFDAEKVFTACRDHGTAVEINSRPERRDPPTRLLKLALEIGCDFSIDTDAHAPGQLDFLGYGAQRALDNGVPVERIVNTWPVEQAAGSGPTRSGSQSGSMRHLQPGVAAEQHAARHAPLPKRWRTSSMAASMASSRRERRPPTVRDVERQLQLLGAVAVDVGHRETRPASDRARRSAARRRRPVARAAARMASVDAVARGMVCDRVARPKSSNRSRSTTVRPVRSGLAHPAGDAVDQVDHDGVDLAVRHGVSRPARALAAPRPSVVAHR